MSRNGPNALRVRLARIHGTARRLAEQDVGAEAAIAELVDVAADHPRRTKAALARRGPATPIPRPDLLSRVAGEYGAGDRSTGLRREHSLALLIAAAEACGGLDFEHYVSGRQGFVCLPGA